MMQYCTVSEAADYLRISVTTLYRRVRNREITFRRHGSKLMFTQQDLDAYSEKFEVTATSLLGGGSLTTRRMNGGFTSTQGGNDV